MAERVAKVQAEHPDQDLKASSQWWTPVIDLRANMQQELDPAINQKANDAAQRVLESKFDPQLMAEAHEELETLLPGQHEELLKSVNATIFAS
ncbi:hypothetical protein F5884DRAFT_903062 [Xylogone sp. PMI_703]|nr:hypothetical protein F5884DRAFT_903062 [Xylogone sp. PMI_703]